MAEADHNLSGQHGVNGNSENGQKLATVKIYRPAAGQKEERYETFQIPYTPGSGTTLLDGLMWLRENVDPTLAIRYACRIANACKTCSAKVNGKNVYTCTVRLSEEVLVVDPSIPKKHLRDIVSEMG